MQTYIATASAAIAVLTAVTTASAQTGTDACGFEHPKKATETRTSLVQAFTACDGYISGVDPNDSTESGVPACSPPETFNEQNAGFDPHGWLWDETNSRGDVSLQAAKNTLENPILNPPDDTADMTVSISLLGVVDANGPVTGNGTLTTLTRVTLRDRNGTPGNHTDDVPMTVVDFPGSFPISLMRGRVKLRTSFNTVLNGFGTSLPKCVNVEVIDVAVYDTNGNRFASMGVLLPAQ